ncbi:M23 family metallopeptidase [bacterium D16-51]|nr:M23 family metallopeptidase [bacterium D16-59]RKI62070.1 M23 family metallopeptidase [bacterium D16-51]
MVFRKVYTVWRRFSTHRKSICWMLFWLLVAGSILWQVTELPELGRKLSVRSKMEKECSAQEVKALLGEIKCFPVREDRKEKETVSFDNGYGAARTYGGDRSHEGIDIMSSIDKPGYFQVQSVSDGVVEQMGWLPLGGYRIGIRSKSGFYYYYAHLDSYAETMKPGKQVSPGEVLGLMGNTGYGKEGTKGKFAVHLHFGIYRQVKGKEKSLNPYYLLEYVKP